MVIEEIFYTNTNAFYLASFCYVDIVGYSFYIVSVFFDDVHNICVFRTWFNI